MECVTPSGSRGNVDEKVHELTGFKSGTPINNLLSNVVDFVTKKANNHFRFFDGQQHGFTLFTFTSAKVSAQVWYGDIRDINSNCKPFETLEVKSGANKWS